MFPKKQILRKAGPARFPKASSKEIAPSKRISGKSREPFSHPASKTPSSLSPSLKEKPPERSSSKKKREKEKQGAGRRSSESSLKSQPFYRRYKPILPTSLNYIVLNRPEAIHLGDLMRFLVRIDPNRSATTKKKDENSEKVS